MVLPLALSIAGGVLPGVISAIAGSKTPEQARKAVKPQWDAMVAQLIGRGMPRAAAEAQAEEAIQGAVAEKMQEGALPGWAEALLGVAGGVGGWMAGAKLAAKKGAQALSKAATPAKDVPKLPAPESRAVALPAKGSAENPKTVDAKVRTADEVDVGATTMDGVPLNIDEAAGTTRVLSDSPTTELRNPFHDAETVLIDPRMAPTRPMQPVPDPRLAETRLDITRLMPPFRG